MNFKNYPSFKNNERWNLMILKSCWKCIILTICNDGLGQYNAYKNYHL